MGFNSKILFALSLFSNKISTSPQYSNYTLEDGRVCLASQDKGELSLGRENKSAIIIKDEYFFDDWPGRRHFDCRFTINAHFNMGIFAVIQRMSLRRDPDTGSCIDFIQFRPAPPFGQRILMKAQSLLKKPHDPWDKTYCGEVTSSDRPQADASDPTLSQTGYVAKEGKLEVRIHVADRKLDPGESLGVEIAFTAFMAGCKTGFSVYKACGEDTCIYNEYFSDKVINCPFVTCKDEPDCAAYMMETEVLEKGLNTKVYITAVSSIFLSFFLFLGCVMLCRYFDLFCWSEPPQVTEGAATELEHVSPTAPQPESPDKDLPPAYETLFPSR